MKKLTTFLVLMFAVASMNGQTLQGANGIKMQKIRPASAVSETSIFDAQFVRKSSSEAKANLLSSGDFEGTTGNALPAGWLRTGANVAGAALPPVVGAWTTADGNISFGGSKYTPHGGTRMGASYAAGPNVMMNAWLFTPALNLTTGTRYRVSFWYYVPVSASSAYPPPANRFEVKMGTGQQEANMDPAVLFSSTTNTDGWAKVSFIYTPTATGNYHIGFHDYTPAASPHSGFTVLLDDVSVEVYTEYDLELISNFPYTQFPVSLPFLTSLSAQVKNTGSEDQSNVTFSATLDGTPLGRSTPITTLPSGETSGMMTITPNITTVPPGEHSLVYTVTSDQINQGTTNTAIYKFEGTANTYAVDAVDTCRNSDGVGSNSPYYTFGNIFEITKATDATAIVIGFESAVSLNYSVSIFRMKDATTIDSVPLTTQTATRSAVGFATVKLQTPVELLPGRYFVCINQTGYLSVSVACDKNSNKGFYVKSGTNLNLNKQGFGAVAIRLLVTGNIPVAVASTTPANNTVDVTLDAEVKVTFNQHITPNVLAGIFFSPSVTGVSASVVGKDLVIEHDDFALGVRYTVYVPAGAIDGYNTPISWTFTTRFPVADFTDPHSLAVDVVGKTAAFTWDYGHDMPYTEGMEGTSGTNLPAGWMGTISGDNGWHSTAGTSMPGYSSFNIPAHGGNRYMAVSWVAKNCWAYSKGIKLMSGTTYTIQFWYIAPGDAGYQEPDNFSVYIGQTASPDAMATSQAVYQQVGVYGPNEWTLAEMTFTPTVAGIYYLGFYKISSQQGAFIGIDDISITSTTSVEAAESFNVFFNEVQVDNVTDMQYAFSDLTTGDYVAGVQAVGPTGLLSNIRSVYFTIVPLAVISKTPAENTTNVRINAQVKVTFNRGIIEGTPADITFTPNVGGVSASINGSDLIISHDNFEMETSYTVNIPGGFIEGYDDPISWSFKTKSLEDPRDLATGNVGQTVTLTWQHGPEVGTPYDEGFEGTSGSNLPANWTRSTGTFAPVWVGISNTMEGIYDNQGRPAFLPPHAGTRHMGRCWERTGYYAWAFSDGIGLVSGVQYTVEFWYRAPGYSSQYDKFELQIAPSLTITGTGANAQMTNGTTIFSHTDKKTPNYIPYSCQFTPDTTGLYYLGFHDLTPKQEGLFILVDGISITTDEVLGSDAASFNIFLDGQFKATVPNMQYAFADLAPGSYTAGVQAVSAEGRLSDTVFTNFTVNATTVISKTPSDGETDVAIDALVSVTFNQPVAAGTLADITITPNDNNVSANINGANLIISHDYFAYGTQYTVTVPAGAIVGYDTPITWTFTTTVETGIASIELNNISIYPNPVSDKLYIQSILPVKRMEVYDIQGKLVKSVLNNVNELSVGDLKAGIYVLKITTDSGTATQRFVRE